MFVGVKYYRLCPGKGHANICIVNSREVGSKSFDPACINPSKLFYIRCDKGSNNKCPAFILFVANTKKEALAKLSSGRPKHAPLSKAIPPSSDSEAGTSTKPVKKTATKRVFKPPSAKLPTAVKAKIARMRNSYENDKTQLSSSNDSSDDDGDFETEKEDKNNTERSRVTKIDTRSKNASTNSKNLMQENPKHRNLHESDAEASWQEEIAMLQSRLKENEVQLAEKNAQIEALRRRNSGLQDKLLLRLDTLDKSIEDIETEAANARGKETFEKVGALNKDNKIHIGRNVWMMREKYDLVLVAAKSPYTFINHLAEAIFGLKTLLNSSVKGVVSNRTKKLNPTARPLLNGSMVCAIQECFEYWASTCSPSYDQVQIQLYKSEVPSILNKHITKLRAKHCKKSLTLSTSDGKILEQTDMKKDKMSNNVLTNASVSVHKDHLENLDQDKENEAPASNASKSTDGIEFLDEEEETEVSANNASKLMDGSEFLDEEVYVEDEFGEYQKVDENIEISSEDELEH